MVFVRVRDQPDLVEVFSPVLLEVQENQRLYQKLSELTHRMPELRPIDCGPLRNARYVEAATVLLLEINQRRRARSSLRIVGLDPGE